MGGGGLTGGGWGGWEAGGGLYLPIALFGVVMSPRTAIHWQRQVYRALRNTCQ